jgi:hypothetical protein
MLSLSAWPLVATARCRWIGRPTSVRVSARVDALTLGGPRRERSLALQSLESGP